MHRGTSSNLKLKILFKIQHATVYVEDFTGNSKIGIREDAISL
jgi:hypothetical protein